MNLNNKQLTQAFTDYAQDPMRKRAAEEVGENLIKTRLRDSGIWRRIQNVEPVDESELQWAADSDEPCVIVDVQPESPASVHGNFNADAERYEILGRNAALRFHKNITPKFGQDIYRLQRYSYDIRKILSDTVVKDLMDLEDEGWLNTIDLALGGAAGATADSGEVQWQTYYGGITRDNLVEARKLMPSNESKFVPETYLMNHITAIEFAKFQPDEIGEELSKRLLTQADAVQDVVGGRLVTTIKDHLVPTNAIYQFAPENGWGVAKSRQEPVMTTESQDEWIEWYMYEYVGFVIANTLGLCRTDFETGTPTA